MNITISKIEYSFSIHATEDFDKNMEALENLIPEDLINQIELIIEELEGGYGNPVEYVIVAFNKSKIIAKIFDSLVTIFSESQKKLLYAEFEERFNADKKSFHIRIDKQAIFNNKITISSSTDIIKIEIKLRSYVKDVDFKQFLVDKGLLLV